MRGQLGLEKIREKEKRTETEREKIEKEKREGYRERDAEKNTKIKNFVL